MSDVMLSLVIAECKHPVEACAGGLEDKLRAAMNVAKDHWMVLDRDTQFRGAIGAVMSHYGQDSEEYKRMEHEIDSLRQLSAFLAASQAGLAVALPDTTDTQQERPEPIGIMKIWHEVVA